MTDQIKTFANTVILRSLAPFCRTDDEVIGLAISAGVEPEEVIAVRNEYDRQLDRSKQKAHTHNEKAARSCVGKNIKVSSGSARYFGKIVSCEVVNDAAFKVMIDCNGHQHGPFHVRSVPR